MTLEDVQGLGAGTILIIIGAQITICYVYKKKRSLRDIIANICYSTISDIILNFVIINMVVLSFLMAHYLVYTYLVAVNCTSN